MARKKKGFQVNAKGRTIRTWLNTNICKEAEK
jgi:hypothetical protein